ncbi:hypothetical protein LF41_838 [Lysobacter dokdonensis DS-58]|uniref:VCBS repeat-containing protein n=1 Tax=Lysobacter dokdonensis DS-58 TaxID=1300345 RepID=A0A0A2WNI8_9GAMM|nr:VCBS repeat-containing protein [Lysobacter dokdonensis]KGQ20302.1 hypothetical protein LF41_838 [Lysobacter dokdonensis DS-58]
MQAINGAAALAVAVLVAIAGSAGARDFEFNTSPTYLKDAPAMRSSSEWVDIGDANNDGRDDLSVVVWDPWPTAPDTSPVYRHVNVRLQRDDGSLAAPLSLSLPMTSMNTVEAVDLDGNGQNELVVGYDEGLAIYRWNGAEFVPTLVPASFDCDDMAIGDIDGNGTRDIVCQSAAANVASIYMVASDGTIAGPGYMGTPSSNAARQTKLGDVTGDGRPDLLQADQGMWSFIVYANDGEGGFLPPRSYAYPLDYYTGFNGRGIEAFDTDGDGTLEVVVGRECNTPCANLLVYRNGSDGYLRLAQIIATLDNPDALEKADVDGDGYPDLLVTHGGYSTLGRYMGGPDGMATTEIRSGALNTQATAFFDLGDLNGDGRMDFAINNTGWNAGVKYGMGKRSRDVNGNWMSDLVWRDTTGRTAVWPQGWVSNSMALPNVALPWAVKAAGDFDGDDKADLFWRNPSNGANMIWLGADANTTQDAIPLAPQWQIAGSGDFDGDLHDDILWRNSSTGENAIWFSGRFDDAIAIRAVPDVRWQVAGIGDFDGDRVDDILWRHSATGSNSVWFSADVATSVALAPVQNLAWKVAGIGDFNRDGMDDVLWRNAQSGGNSIWRSANAARQQPVASVGNPAWQVAAVGDYSGDGIDDIVWRNTNGSNLIWLDADAAKQQTLGTAGPAWQVVP